MVCMPRIPTMPVICDQLIAAAVDIFRYYHVLDAMFCVYGDVYCAVIMAERRQEHFWRVSPIGHECVHRDVCDACMRMHS